MSLENPNWFDNNDKLLYEKLKNTNHKMRSEKENNFFIRMFLFEEAQYETERMSDNG